MPDAIVVGSGPNGLAAAITLAAEGIAVRLIEGADDIGGGTRCAELTLPGFVHDVCSAIHPLALASPVLRGLPLAELGLEWVHPPAPLAHPFDDGTAVLLERSIETTAAGLGRDAGSYARLIGPLQRSAADVLDAVLAPLEPLRHPRALARFAARSALPAAPLARLAFREERARALLAGLAAHAGLPLSRVPSAAYGLVLALLAHAVGWPLARGGSQRIADSLSAHLRSLGGEIETARPVRSLDELREADAVLLDLTPRQVVALTGDRLPARYRRRLERYRYGPGAFKLDWALAGPIPWRAPACARAATVHLGCTLGEIAASERAAWRDAASPRPYVVLAQPSLFDPSRAPAGRHTAWAYCHVPNGWSDDMTAAIEAQVERFAPGFGERVLARSAMGPAALEAHNPNDVGGDINGGAALLRQTFTRPVAHFPPWSTPLRGVYICSASTPPGGGVHGLCGLYAARTALRDLGRA